MFCVGVDVVRQNKYTKIIFIKTSKTCKSIFDISIFICICNYTLNKNGKNMQSETLTAYKLKDISHIITFFTYLVWIF